MTTETEPRTKRVSNSFTPAEMLAIRDYAAKVGLHRSEVLRQFMEPKLKAILKGQDPLGRLSKRD